MQTNPVLAISSGLSRFAQLTVSLMADKAYSFLSKKRALIREEETLPIIGFKQAISGADNREILCDPSKSLGRDETGRDL